MRKISVLTFLILFMLELRLTANEYVTMQSIYPMNKKLEIDLFQKIYRGFLFEINKEGGCYGGSYIFDTNVDWHSSVHAHWAMFKLATLHPELNAKILSDVMPLITKRRVQSELTFITTLRPSVTSDWLGKNCPSFKMDEIENPYGFGWFLKMEIAYKEWAKANSELGFDPHVFDVLTDHILRKLEENVSNMDWVVANLKEHTYQNSAWAMVTLLEYYKYYNNQEGINRIRLLTLQLLNMQDVLPAWINNTFISPKGLMLELAFKTLNKETFEKYVPYFSDFEDKSLKSCLNNRKFLGYNQARLFVNLVNYIPMSSTQKEYFLNTARNCYQSQVNITLSGGEFYDHWRYQFQLLSHEIEN